MTLLLRFSRLQGKAFLLLSTGACLGATTFTLAIHSAWAYVNWKRTFVSPYRSSAAWRISSRLNTLGVGREADYLEMMVGGERYSMVPLPDSMVDTTLFVGNLCEFVKDEDLSNLFRAVSALHFIPACVVRKPNAQSMQYGFVSFPTIGEKEAAIIRFHGIEWRGKKLKVEAIRDHPVQGRVRVPEGLVSYVSGVAKKTRSGKVNELRRISRDDVDRLSRGEPSNKRGYGSRAVPHRLNEEEQAELERAALKGYLTLVGGGNRRCRKGSPLTNIHRQWCDAREKPQIVLYKAVGGQATDKVLVDLSPLRLNALVDGHEAVEDFLVKWKASILSEAYKADMQLLGDVEEEGPELDDISNTAYTVTWDEASSQEAWASEPIWKLPVITMGVFQGGRSKAKTMARSLALLWEIPEDDNAESSRPESRDKRRRTEATGLREHRKRGNGHREYSS